MKQYKPRRKLYCNDVEVNCVPFSSEEARIQAYETHAKLFLRVKDRMLCEVIGESMGGRS